MINNLFLYILKKDKKNPKYLFYALFCIFLSLGYSNIIFSFNSVNEFVVYKISRTSLPISSLFLLYYTLSATKVLKNKIRIASLFAIPTLIFVILFLRERSLENIEQLLKIFALTVNIPYILFAFTLVIISLIKRKRKADFAFAIGFIVLFVAISIDTYNYATNITAYTWLIPHGFLFFIVVIFFILSTEQTKAFNLSIERGLQLQHLKDNLEVTIEERTALIKTQNDELMTQAEYLQDANFEIQTQKILLKIAIKILLIVFYMLNSSKSSFT